MFICSTTSNLNNFKRQQLQPQKRVQNKKKKQNRRPQPRKHTKDHPTLAPLFFGTMRLFLKFFGLHQRVPPSFVSIFCNTMDVKKSQRVPPFTFFGTVTLFKNLLLKNFLGNFFMSPKGPRSILFHFLQPAGVSQSPKARISSNSCDCDLSELEGKRPKLTPLPHMRLWSYF